MSKFRLKILLWFILIAIAVAGCFFVIGRVANLLLYFQEGADPASALNIVPNRPADLKVALEWLPDDPDTGREIEPFTRTQIESAYLRAWLQWNISYLRGEPYGLETYFVGPALEAVTEGVESTKLQGWSLEQTDLEHNLKLHMYSADGSIISMTAHNVKLAQIIRNYDNELIMTDVAEADYDVVMKLEDGNWRVRHWVRREKSDTVAEIKTDIDLTPFAKVEGQQLLVDGEPYTVRGVNYYPKDSPWHEFWPEYDPEIIEQDFDTITGLGLNTIRIFIPYEPKLPEPTLPEHHNESESGETEYVDNFVGIDPYEDIRLKLNDLLQRAEDHDLKVIVTLFDFRTDYQILLWPNADRDLEEIVPYFADNPAILAWDLKNEPDLDQPGNTVVTVNTWLAHVVQKVRENDPNHLVTIGWSTSEAATQLIDLVDFVSFHDYQSQDTLPDRINTLRSAVQNKPIVLTEFGLPTWNSRFFPNGHTEQEQAVYYADVRKILNEAGLSGYMAWTLYDFDDIPSSVVGRRPWNTGPQRKLGLIQDNDEKKWAAFLLAENSNLDVPPLPKFMRFLKPFWQTVFMVIAGIALFTYNRVYNPERDRFFQRRLVSLFANDSQPHEAVNLPEIIPPITQTAIDDSFEMSEISEMSEEMKRPLKNRLSHWLANRRRSREEKVSHTADSVQRGKEMKKPLKIRLSRWLIKCLSSLEEQSTDEVQQVDDTSGEQSSPLITQLDEPIPAKPDAVPTDSQPILEEVRSLENQPKNVQPLGNNENLSPLGNEGPSQSRLINWLIERQQSLEDLESDTKTSQATKIALENNEMLPQQDKPSLQDNPAPAMPEGLDQQHVQNAAELKPTAKTALDKIHRSLGGQMQRSNGWWRPSNYGDVEKEYWAVRKTVSLMDVSTLGKITVAGSDALTFLEQVYPTKVSTIREGRARYVLLLNEHGGIMDDGLIGKVRDAEYQLTLASNDIGKSEKWLRDWAAHWQMDTLLIDQTFTLGAINVTGPLASTLLERVGWTDAAAMKSMRFTDVTIAGVPCQVYRLSFTGEASFVLHHPAERSAELWKTLMNHGSDLGIHPHGLEALALLRLEKGDVAIEHDTDRETTPRHINRDWMCKLEKEFFIGKEALEQSNQAGLDKVLVGFEIEGGHCQARANIMKDRELAGYITSAAWSFALNKGIALGWLKVIGGKLPETVTINGMLAKRVDGPFQLKEAARVRTKSS